ncbi:scaffolding protein [Listeria monocytogenes]|uniref:phage scaffolding protein n=1 Tax=Listeria monocytogenes TaxID=1639 RepID=UPI00087385D4|nr:phage scaffolding protein [Listeria monocytogenes]EAD4272534.1 scaffolding protein [Listeria monocytogenes]EAE9647379.1 scaffolding protein [Listeria monocytogenes]EAK8381984.1 scaffolding protein [Listeria monocytogenes]EBB5812388.1 scaffolding protein [Listeria monocytogenes]EIZ3975488.1 phage scaffolding protein [Listeria monocytogenes]
MQREYLKGLGLEDEVINKVMAENGKDITAAKQQLSEVEAERDGLKSQLTQRDKDIDDLKKDSGTSEELKKQIEDLQQKNTDLESNYQSEIAETKKNSAIELALASAKAKNPKAVRALLDNNKLELTDEGLKGLDEQLGALQESDAYLFAQESENVAPKWGINGNQTNNNPTSKSLADYSYQELADLKTSDPATFESITK